MNVYVYCLRVRVMFASVFVSREYPQGAVQGIRIDYVNAWHHILYYVCAFLWKGISGKFEVESN